MQVKEGSFELWLICKFCEMSQDGSVGNGALAVNSYNLSSILGAHMLEIELTSTV